MGSHAPRERVSWNADCVVTISSALVTLHVSVWVEIPQYSCNVATFLGHAPRERVSWNPKIGFAITNSVVTLHVSVWVEIQRPLKLCDSI